MKKKKIMSLSMEKFSTYGSYSDMTSNSQEKLGEGGIEFFRDILVMNTSETSIAFSVTYVEKRDLIIDVLECHDNTYEAMMPMDEDVLMYFAPATTKEKPEYDRIEVYKIPKSTMVIVKKGVWHCAPFVIDAKKANVLIALPERTYENDCFFTVLDENQKIEIEI